MNTGAVMTSKRTVETMRAFARAILEHANAFEWSLQGFGMFRLYLTKEVRLHVWDSAFAVKDVSTLHTHPWHFRSTVLAGRMVDRLYAFSPGAEQATHMKQLIVCGPGGGMCQGVLPEPVLLQLIQAAEIKTGESYGLTSSAVHESEYRDGTVTVIEREFLSDTEHAHVFYPVGGKWVSAEPRMASGDEIAAMARRALREFDGRP